MITIIDYGAGNLCSVRNTLAELGVGHEVVNTAEAVHSATSIVLPGVGHFGQMMHAIDALGLREPILERIGAGVPFFGICLGMQALFERSEEAPEVRGFGLYPGAVRRFAENARVPHMGWNQIEPDGRFVYFAHSYYVPECAQTSAACAYSDVRFTAAIRAGNVQGVQFHPEKSGPVGLAIVREALGC